MTTSSADYATQPPERGSVSIDELARRKHVQPVQSVDDLAEDGVFDTDEELDAFLAHVHATRHPELAGPPVDRVVLDIFVEPEAPAPLPRHDADIGKQPCITFVTLGELTQRAELRQWVDVTATP